MKRIALVTGTFGLDNRICSRDHESGTKQKIGTVFFTLGCIFYITLGCIFYILTLPVKLATKKSEFRRQINEISDIIHTDENWKYRNKK